VLPLALYLVGTGPGDATAQTATLVLTGDAAPDGNGTFVEFGIPTLNANGDVAFVGALSGTQNGSVDSRGIFIVDSQSITELVRTGEQAPDGNGVLSYFAQDFNNFERVALNDDGEVAFTASLDQTAAGGTDDVGQFGASAVSGLTQFVRISDAAPDGNGEFVLPDIFNPPNGWPLGLNNLGQATFHGAFTNTSGAVPDETGSIRSDGVTVTPLVRAGDTVPGGGDTFEFVAPEQGSNLAGQVAIRASLIFDEMGGGSRDGLERIYVSTGGVLNEFVRDGTPMSDGNGTLVSIFQDAPWISEAGNVLFCGFVADTNDGSDSARLILTDGVLLIPIAHLGQLGPRGDFFRFQQFFGVDSNLSNEVAFSASLYRNLVISRTSGIFRTDVGGIVQLLGEGDPVPGGNGTFGDLAGPIFMNNAGEIAFSAAVEGTANSSDNGIFVIDSNSVVQEVSRLGQPLAGSTILFLMFIDFLGDEGVFSGNTDLAQAGMNGLNDAGQVAFMASLADGNSGVFLWSVPEPSGELLAIAALATVFVLRGRAARLV
jgi:hypothetical protein